MKLSKKLNKQWRYFRTGLLLPSIALIQLKNSISCNGKTPLLKKFYKSIPSSLIKTSKKKSTQELPLATSLGILAGGLLPLIAITGFLARPVVKHNQAKNAAALSVDTQGHRYLLKPAKSLPRNTEPQFFILTRQQAIEMGMLAPDYSFEPAIVTDH